MAVELPLVQDVTIYQGATFRRAWRYLPGGVAQDFTGWSARMKLRPAYDEPEVLSLTTAGGGITLGTDGLIELHITATQTAGLVWTSAGLRYDLEIVQPGAGDVIRFVMGRARISREVTK